MAAEASTYLVKIGQQGLLTIAIPGMSGRYMVVEQRDGCLVISPFDLEGGSLTSAVAREGAEWRLLGTQGGEMPRA
ncbi:MAG: hypothetical protein M1457_09015 [bacterium]|nr:hypothetical protein [bacterium]